MAEMMHMMQQLVVGGGWDSYGPILKGPTPQFENKAQLPPEPNQGQSTPPFVSPRGDQELNLPRDKTSKSAYSQVKSQLESLTEKIHIIEGSGARGSVDLDSLTNFP